MSGLTSSDVSSKEVQETKPLAVIQTIDQKKITDLLEWMRSDLGISEKFEENEKDAAHFVTRILELHKMNTQKVKKYIYKYYKSRSAGGAEVFQNRNSESDEILKSCQSVYLFTLPHLTKGGQRIIYSKIAPGTKADDFDQKAFFKRFFMVSDIRFKEEASGNGDLFIFDMEGFTRSHAMKLFSGGYMNKFIKSVKETYPRKLNTIHIIRTKPWHKNAIGIWLKMSGLSKKILDRVKTHPVQEEGLEGLGVQMEQLSGRLQDLNDAMTQRLIAHSTWFESREVKFQTLTIKSIKLDKPKGKSNPEEQLYISSNSEIYTFKSLEGIFRQINVDDK